MDQLGWGLQISALGMGLVFALLALLWGLLTLVLKLDSPPPVAAAPQDAEAPSPDVEPATTALPTGPEPALVAAITMAVLAYSVERRSEAAPEVRLHWPGTLLHASRWVAAGRMRQNRSWHRGR